MPPFLHNFFGKIMKMRRFLVAGFAVLTAFQASLALALPQYAYMYEYYDANGYTVGYKYIPCGGRISQGGTITSDFSVELLPCSFIHVGSNPPIESCPNPSIPGSTC